MFFILSIFEHIFLFLYYPCFHNTYYISDLYPSINVYVSQLFVYFHQFLTFLFNQALIENSLVK